MPFLPLALVLAAIASIGDDSTAAAAVLDVNFVDLAEVVQAHPFLAVAFYSPGCGHCRRLLPSWTQAGDLLEDQDLPIRLARMDVSSRGGMLAWKEFGLTRVPAVKIFVDYDVDGPLPYTGHLDARGIAAHLAMVERDRRRLQEHQEKYSNPAVHNRRVSSGDGALPHEPEGSGVTLVTFLSSASSSTVVAEQQRQQREQQQQQQQQPQAVPSLTDKFREAVGRQGLSLVLFVAEDTPKAHRMIVEFRKAAPLLTGSDPPMKAVRVDMQPPGGSSNRVVGGSGSRKLGRQRGPAVSSSLASASTKGEFAADIGVPLGDGPELRIFLDGNPWIDGGVFRGMPTADGISQHMEWVAIEAGLPPQNEL